MDFGKVILADKLRQGIIGQAARDGLLTMEEGGELGKAFYHPRNRQEALSLLVLFEKILIPNFESALNIPIIEDSGIAEFIPVESKLRSPAENLERTVETRPFVLNKLMSIKDSYWINLAKESHVSRRTLYDALIDYFLALYRNDEQGIRDNLLSQIYPPEVHQYIVERLYEPLKSENKINAMKALYALAVYAADDIGAYQELSGRYQAGIATKDFTGGSADWTSVSEVSRDISNLSETFCLVRCALNEEGFFFPKIENIKHALILRKDPNLQAFREQLALFQSHLIKGDREATVLLRKEVSKSKLKLMQAKRWDTTLKLITYFSLPANIVESITLGIPIVGTTLSIFSVAATAAVENMKQRNQWVLFGR
jgi:hypothetical protein